VHVLIITDAYPPMRTSCAVQMYDLGQAFIDEGHQVTIVTSSSKLKEKISILHKDGIRLVKVKALETKDINYICRTFAEFINPFLIWHKLQKSPEFIETNYDGILWYSPTIFWGPLIRKLKQQFHVKTFLILRDIFPQWALDLGLIKKGLSYKFLEFIERYQYSQADTIGVQSPNNLKYFEYKYPLYTSKVVLLWNWTRSHAIRESQIKISESFVSGRTILVYAGNVGVSQDSSNLVSLIKKFKDNQTVGIILIGRGSEFLKIKSFLSKNDIKNTLIFDEVDPSELISLLKQCDIGIITLDLRHTTQNIPGKFLSYLEAGLPVLAFVNADNDLLNIIKSEEIGVAYSDLAANVASQDLQYEIDRLKRDSSVEAKANTLLSSTFSSKEAVNLILNNL